MEFQPPDPASLANVQSLNLEFLDFVRTGDRPFAAPEPLPAELFAALCRLGSAARSRLARSPFLVFSLAEDDEMRWGRLFDDGQQADLVSGLHRPGITEIRLVSAALGFLWQLAIVSPHAARIVSGAPLHWCERLAQRTLVSVLRNATNEVGLLQFRCGDNVALWRKLISAGSSDERAVRRAAQMTALQTLLTSARVADYRQLPAAACAMPGLPRTLTADAVVSRPGMRGYNTPPDESAVDQKPLEDLSER